MTTNQPNREYDIDSLDLDTVRHLRIRQLVPGLDSLPGVGPAQEQIPSGVRWRIIEYVSLTWSAFGNLSIGEMLSWRSTGQGKVKLFVKFLRDEVERRGNAGVAAATETTDQLTDALRRVAAWGAVAGAPHLVDAIAVAAMASDPSAPLQALKTIMDTDLREFAGPELLLLADPIDAANDILAQFDGREKTILTKRILVTHRPDRATLEQIGEELDLTRERVRQLQVIVVNELAELIGRDKYRAFRRRADEIHRAIGVACPVDLAPREVRPNADSQVDELFSYVAGQYQLSDGWLVMPGVGTVQEIAHSAVQSAGLDDISDYEDAVAELEALGFTRPAAERAIRDLPDIHMRDNRVYLWPQTMGDKAYMLLHLAGEIQTSEELFASIPKAENINSFRNALGADERIRRVGKDRYGLKEWSGEEYQGVVPAMIEAITRAIGPVSVSLLGAELAERFGISAKSVTMNAAMHPAFKTNGDFVSLRSTDDPYIPKTGIELTKSCFMIDGAWGLRMKVDHDMLRGSGRGIPEQFAVHLGVLPGTSARIPAPYGDVWVGWEQTPHIGSVRVAALGLGLGDGDYMFVTRPTPNTIDFVGVPREEESDPRAALSYLVGSEYSQDRSWQRVLGDALGFGAAIEPSAELLKNRIETRGDADIAQVLDRLMAD